MFSIIFQAKEKLAWHRDQSHLPVICSAASQFSVLPVAEHLDIQHSIHTTWLVSDGHLTGRLKQPIVYGLGKVHWIEQWCKEHRVNLARSYFYSDSISDRPLLELVGHPIAVNPDVKLEQFARQQSWPVLWWRE
ncbi:HAD-IB family hydrolase [Chloroflexi bacterium TSY]|nr:HAD-IB family hydrolase [Chloroflexi bacterium TSY]